MGIAIYFYNKIHFSTVKINDVVSQ
jgi:hypothetical protein